MGKTVLTPAIEQYILNNYLKESSKDIAIKFGFSREVVQRYLRVNNLIIPAETLRYFRTKANLGKTTCTPSDDEFIKANYLTLPPQRIADVIGGSEHRIKTRMRQLGLIVPREIIEKRIADARIKKGNISHNKGKKQSEYMSPEAIERTKSTRFVKGQIPKNSYNEVGKITVRHDNGGRKYLHICIEVGKWEMLHVHNWKKAGLTIPEGHSLWFINGDSTDCRLENLECISRAENLRRNTLSDSAIASKLARVSVGRKGNFIDWEAKKEYLKFPELIAIKRTQLQLVKALRESKK